MSRKLYIATYVAFFWDETAKIQALKIKNLSDRFLRRAFDEAIPKF